MKTYVVALIVISLLGTGYYFLFHKDGGAGLNSAYETFKQKIATIGEAGSSGIKAYEQFRDVVGAGIDKLKTVTSILSKAPDFVSSTLGRVEQKIPPEAIKFLSDPQAITKEKLSGFISANGYLATSSRGLGDDICVKFSNTSHVEYTLGNPFTPAKEYNYEVVWGDGSFATGTVQASDQPLLLTHGYKGAGNYLNAFKISAATTTLSAEINVCIQ